MRQIVGSVRAPSAALALLCLACGVADPQSGGPPAHAHAQRELGQGRAEARARLSVARRPADVVRLARQEVRSIVLDVDRVVFENVDEKASTEIEVGARIDLLAGGGGFGNLLANLVLPAGRYKAVRVILGPAGSVTLASGAALPLRVPSGNASGYKLVGDFALLGGRITYIAADFAAAEALEAAGDGRFFILRPLAHISSMASLTPEQEQALVDALGPLGDAFVDASDLIVEGTTRSTSADLATAANGAEIIVTKVGIDVADELKGTAGASLTYEVLGGQVGERTLLVTHVPHFVPGDHYLLFLKDYGTGLGTVQGDLGKVPM